MRIEPTRSVPEPVEIRFHGLGFEGRFEIKVVGCDRWTLHHDYPEHESSRTKVTTIQASTKPSQPRFSQRFSSPNIKVTPDQATDPARFTGAQGGCTLSITPTANEQKLIQIQISKKGRNQEAVGNLVKIGAMLTEANRRATLLIDDLEEEEYQGRLGTMQPGEKELRRANAVLQAMKGAMGER
jgi:hypothetical protein